MHVQSKNHRCIAKVGEALASWLGLVVHRLARYTRRAVATTTQPEATNVAVMCVGFLRYGASQAVGLKEIGLNVTLYYVERRTEFAVSEEDRELFLEHAKAAGVTVVRVPRRRIRALLTDTLWLHRDLRRRRIGSAVVQSHIDPRYATVGLALPVALMLHDPQPHSGDTLSTFSVPIQAIARVAELTAVCVIIHSPELRGQIRPLLWRLPIRIVPHGADMAAAPAPIPSERRLLVFGRLFAYKGVDTALDAFRLLSSEVPDTKLIVAGRGPLADLAHGRANVEVREEYIAERDVDALLRGVRLVLLPYKDATQSGVGLQAVARGIPCVVSSAGGLPELVGPVSSLIVPPGDPGKLANAIALHVDHDEHLRRALYEHAETRFAWPVVAQRLRDELRDAMLSS